jgi:hypothetical protein
MAPCRDRKALLRRDAREVGKSYLVRSWAEGPFRNLVEVSPERDTKALSRLADNAVTAQTRSGKTARFTLLSLPLYLVEQLPRLWGERETVGKGPSGLPGTAGEGSMRLRSGGRRAGQQRRLGCSAGTSSQ